MSSSQSTNDHDATQATEEHLPEYIDLDAAVSIYKERIRNLEKFRDLFFETKEKLIQKENIEHNRKSNNEQRSITTERLSKFKAQAQDNIDKIKTLEDAIQSMEVKDEEQSDVIQQQLNELATLNRSISETSACIQILESEIEDLLVKNEILEEKLSASQENNDSEENSDDPNYDMSQKHLKRIETLEKELADTTNMAFSAMRSNADIGSVIHFLVESFKSNTIEELVDLVFHTIDSYSVTGLMEITFNGKSNFHTADKKVASELKISLQNSSRKGKSIDVNNHLVFNAAHVRIAIKGANREDIISFNNLKDNMQILALGIDSNIERIYAETSSTKERKNLERLVISTHKTLDNIENKHKKESSHVHKIAIEAMQEFKISVSKLKVPIDQKNILLKQLHNKINDIEVLIKNTKLVDDSFVQIINSLSESINKKK